MLAGEEGEELPEDFTFIPPPSNEEGREQALDIVHGEPLTDRKSTFQAHVASVHSTEEVCRYSNAGNAGTWVLCWAGNAGHLGR
jgi:hypothetical protein